MKLWCILTKPLGIDEPWGVYCDPGFDYYGESEEYIAHDFGGDLSGAHCYDFTFKECLKRVEPFWRWRYEGIIDLIVPVFLAKLLFLRNTIKSNRAFDEYVKRHEADTAKSR